MAKIVIIALGHSKFKETLICIPNDILCEVHNYNIRSMFALLKSDTPNAIAIKY